MPYNTRSRTRALRARYGSDYNNYIRDLMGTFHDDYVRRRVKELEAESDAGTSDMHASRRLEVELVEFYAVDNAREHHTDEYEIVQDRPATPVLRRGQPFHLAVRFKGRGMESKTDKLHVTFTFGPKPSVSKGTKVVLPVTMREFTKKGKWDIRVQQQDGNNTTLQVQIPPTCQVGVWKCSIQTSAVNGRTKKTEFHCKEKIFILFNPWCKDDTVFLQSDHLRREYVMNDTGKVYVGAYRRSRGRRWVFGQFDDVVLPAIQYLLELSDLSHTDRGSAVKMVRAISAVVNSSDEDGLLTGRWDGEYKDGVAPWVWTGSVKIFDEYMKKGGQPVKYGQCWVFSCLTTTVCRALGIPCRTVTNFVSAHDTDCTLTIDTFYDVFGDEIEGGPDGESFDSIWNFHVWNDVWMARPDLPPGYGGWQAIDATPQEESDNKMQCGPASLEAIRRGEVGFAYDTPFLFSEVNADVIHWQEDEEADLGFSRIKANKYHVGREILTKRADRDDDDSDDDREDIVRQYKNIEGSASERLAVFNAVRGVDRAQDYYELPTAKNEDVSFDLVELEKILIGQPFTITVNVQNRSNQPRTISAVISASTVHYTGVRAHVVKRHTQKFTIQPKQREALSVRITADDYFGKLVDYGMMKIYSIAKVEETRQAWSDEDDFAVEKPKLKMQVRGQLQVGNAGQVTFTFQNPLAVPLTECQISFEGAGLQRPSVIKLKRDVAAKDTMNHTERFTPRKSGEKKLVATFSSRELIEVSGSLTINVRA